MFLQILILTLQSSAFFQTVPFSEIATRTGLDEKIVIRQTERDLESYLFYEDDGISCGLESFSIEGYEVRTTELNQNLEKFTVITEVEGPVSYCGGTDTFMCYTTWGQKEGSWQALFTECPDEKDWHD